MQNKDFSVIIEKLNFDRLDKIYFNHSKYHIVLNKEKDHATLYLKLKQAIGFELYQKLIQGLSEAIELDLTLIIEAEESDLGPKDIQAYVKQALTEHEGFIRINDLNILEDDGYVFLLDSVKELDKIEPQLEQLTQWMKNRGIILKFFVRQRISPELVIESKERVAEHSNEVNTALPKYRKSKLDDYPLTQLSDIYVGLKEIKVIGEIFDIEDQWVRNNSVLRKTIYFYDGTDALSFLKFLEKPEELQKYNAFKIGQSIEVYGDIVYDNYGKELLINAKEVRLTSDLFKRNDDASLKHVELHVHSNMSEMDATASVESYIKQAFEWGHEGIAITDHNSVQAYPKAQKQVESLLKMHPERQFKMIYGCEFDVVNDHLNIVYRPDDRLLRDLTFVVFDLETTGLSKQDDRIIEFGGVKLRNGMVIERLQMFVNPGFSLTDHISRLTNITNDDLINAKREQDYVQEWEAFFKDCVLVAHNASFDQGFINEAFKRCGLNELKIPVIDTLDLSRALFEDKRSYRLGNIAKYLKLSYDEDIAHRADYDAEVLSTILQKWLNEDLKDLSLNDLSSLGSKDSYKKLRRYHVNVLAKNEEGLKSIYQLVSLAHIQGIVNNGKEDASGEARLKRSHLVQHRKDLLVGSACLNSEVFDTALVGTLEDLKQVMAFYDYVEIQSLENYSHLISEGNFACVDDLKKILIKIVDCAIELKIPIIASSDAHYLHPKDAIFRDVYIQAKAVGSARHPLYIYNEEKRRNAQSPKQHLRTTQELLENFEFLGEKLASHLVIHNSKLIANQIDVVKPIKKDLYTPSIEGADDKLKALVYANAYEKYGKELPQVIKERLEKELNSIIGHGFGVIYYIAHLLVKKSLDDGYMVGSRGSVGSSLVAHLSHITEVNPLAPHYVCPQCQHTEFVNSEVDSGFDLLDKNCPVCENRMNVDGHDIPFETFLGFEGDKVPDIDLNFSGDYQEQAHAYTKVLFGEQHVFRAGTISTVAQRTAYGYVKGYFEEMGIDKPIRSAMMNYLAKGCEGVKRTTGQHPGGIIVIPQTMDVYDFTPVQYPANKASSSWLTTHFEFADIHDNVLKLDILGHVDPTAMKMLERLSGVDVKSIKMNDQSAISLFNSTQSLNILKSNYPEKTGALGLPEFGTNFVRQILSSTQPKNFSDLVRVSGLSHGTDVWLNNAKDLISLGYPFREVIGCRDDIMVYLIHKGLPSKQAFDIMESVRKGKGLKDEWKALMAQFDVPDWYIQSCLKIKYMFPKAHAVAYVLMAVRVAWFKVHHPMVYYATYFTLRSDVNEYESIIGGYDTVFNRFKNIQSKLSDAKLKSTVSTKEESLLNTLEAVLEMMSRGYHFAPLDLSLSLATEYRIHPQNDKALIPPFTILDGLGENVAKSIVEARDQRHFISKEDLQQRTLINTTQIKNFEKFGLLETLDDANQMALF